MKKFFRLLTILCIYALIYMVLIEKISWLNFAIGLAVSTIAIIFSDKYFLFDEYSNFFPINPLGFLLYFFYLIANVMTSGVKAAILTVRGDAKLHFAHYESGLKNEFALNLLSNSITLTPGTVTVNRKDNDLLIMQLCKKGEQFDTKSIEEFEKNINKFVVRES
ncbi:MAG: Na+/H+ antiporter subunit E [Eubacteriales bacterium]